MDFLISAAHAQGAAQGQGGGLGMFVPLIILIAFMYFLIIRPQSKRAKEHRAMVSALNSGDEVVTSGGVIGRITEVGEQFVTLEISDGVEVKLQKNSVGAVLPKGTMNSA